jgi:NAD-dependent dihydropyrimidine dehydrogenase PreA subunit
MTTAVRKIVKIDADKCDGCGLCVPSCAEGAIRIIDGKARLVAENLCDGLGNCLGTCPKDAITIEERPAEAFSADRDADASHAHAAAVTALRPVPQVPAGGCPGSMMRLLRPDGAAQPAGGPAPADEQVPSALRHWPVQLVLLPESGPIWDDADVLLAADCVPVVMPDFHRRLLVGKTVAVACPKLDDRSEERL